MSKQDQLAHLPQTLNKLILLSDKFVKILLVEWHTMETLIRQLLQVQPILDYKKQRNHAYLTGIYRPCSGNSDLGTLHPFKQHFSHIKMMRW